MGKKFPWDRKMGKKFPREIFSHFQQKLLFSVLKKWGIFFPGRRKKTRKRGRNSVSRERKKLWSFWNFFAGEYFAIIKVCSMPILSNIEKCLVPVKLVFQRHIHLPAYPWNSKFHGKMSLDWIWLDDDRVFFIWILSIDLDKMQWKKCTFPPDEIGDKMS